MDAIECIIGAIRADTHAFYFTADGIDPIAEAISQWTAGVLAGCLCGRPARTVAAGRRHRQPAGRRRSTVCDQASIASLVGVDPTWANHATFSATQSSSTIHRPGCSGGRTKSNVTSSPGANARGRTVRA